MKKMIAKILMLTLLVLPIGSYSVSATEYSSGVLTEDTTKQSTDISNEETSEYNKMHFYFNVEAYETIDDIKELEKAIDAIPEIESNQVTGISTYQLTNNAQESNEVTITVEFESDFMETEKYIEYSEQRENLKTSEDVLAFREGLNSYSKEYHEELIEECLDELEVLEYSEIEAIGYSPFVTLKVDATDLDVEALVYLSECENIENISVEYEPVPETEASWTNTLKGIEAYDIVTDGTYTGEGVRIGIYESGGVCDITHTNLVDKDITLRNSSTATTSHATNVASILSLIAPEAEYYVSDVNQIGIAWFIEQNCDIVNCSFGYSNNTKNSDGTYTEGTRSYKYSIDAVYDYQIRAHFITVCKSAGNKNTNNTSSSYNPDAKVTSPGYAYNVITVGGANRTYTDSAYRWTHASGACYACTSPRVKPNVVAGYTVSIPNVGTGSGTSYASPQVAGCIALLLDKNSAYSAYPERVLSVITSTAQKTYDYSATIGDFDNKVGAGLVSLEGMLNSSIYQNKSNTNTTAKTNVISKSVYLSAGTEVQIGLGWLVTVDLDEEEVYVTDYDLRIYDSSGNLVKSTYLTNTNIEVLRTTITSSGTYTIVAYQYGTMDDNVSRDWMSLTVSY